MFAPLRLPWRTLLAVLVVAGGAVGGGPVDVPAIHDEPPSATEAAPPVLATLPTTIKLDGAGATSPSSTPSAPEPFVPPPPEAIEPTEILCLPAAEVEETGAGFGCNDAATPPATCIEGYGYVAEDDGSEPDCKIITTSGMSWQGNPNRMVTGEVYHPVDWYTDIATLVGQDGNIRVAYVGGSHLKLMTCQDARCERATVTIIVRDAVDRERHQGPTYQELLAGFPSLALSGDGVIIVSYWRAGELWLTFCEDPACITRTAVAIDRTPAIADAGRVFPAALVVDKQGLPFLAYFDRIGHQLRTAKCLDPRCGTVIFSEIDGDGRAQPPKTWGETHSVGWTPQAVLDPAGLPLIAYATSSFTGGIHLARCLDPSCQASVKQQVGTHLTLSDRIGLVVGADGNPVLAYISWSAPSFSESGLRVLRCDDFDCGSYTVTDASPGMRPYTVGLGLDATGSPLLAVPGSISDTEPGLRVARCLDASCSAREETWRRAMGSLGKVVVGTMPGGVSYVAHTGGGDSLHESIQIEFLGQSEIPS